LALIFLCIYAGVCLGILVVGILAILLAFLMLKRCSNKGTVADLPNMGDQHEVAFLLKITSSPT